MKTIGVVAKELNINVETIKFYERKGLITQPVKPDSGYRVYDGNLISRIKFILKAKTLGFTLQEISTLLNLSSNCKEVESMGLQKLTLIRNKIDDLKKLASVIDELTSTCQNNQDNSLCPIIESISNH
jgi:MerR family transcriptional regulator, mercuric resistance operon regulatory protein